MRERLNSGRRSSEKPRGRPVEVRFGLKSHCKDEMWPKPLLVAQRRQRPRQTSASSELGLEPQCFSKAQKKNEEHKREPRQKEAAGCRIRTCALQEEVIIE
jgi:hypothetical protein